MVSKKLIVAGGGAAGFFCAINAARLNPELKVVVYEKSAKLLSKVKVSGGGRCNVTHACTDINAMSRNYPRGGMFLKKAFHQFFIHDTISWFDQRGIKLKTESDGRMFPVTDSSQSIIDCFLSEAGKLGVEVRIKTEIKELIPAGNKWRVVTNSGTEQADFVCLACGGFPSGPQFEWIRNTGHTIVDPVPSLFTFNMPGHAICGLQGISVPEVSVKIAGTSFVQTGPLLITHWGLSGPAVLKLSAWAARELHDKKYQFSVIVNWVPVSNETAVNRLLQQYRFELARQMVKGRNPFGIPVRLWDFLVESSAIPASKRWADLNVREQNLLAKSLCSFELRVNGKTTFKEEFVTAGGVSLEEIDPGTMESRIAKGLFFAGEIMDIDGVTGGFNFQNAWTTAMIAAETIAVRAASDTL